MKIIITLLISALAALSTGCTASAGSFSGKARFVRVSDPAVSIAAAPSILAADADGGVFVAWVEPGSEKAANIFVQKYDASGKPAGEKSQVNPPGVKTTAWRGDPVNLAMDADGTIFAVWSGRNATEASHGSDLFLSVSRDGGKSFDAPVKVNDDQKPYAVHAMSSLAVDRKGRIFVSWLDERYLPPPTTPKPGEKHQHREENREVYFAVSADGGKSFSPNKKLAANACPCCKTAVAVAPDGSRIYVSWRQVLPDDYRHFALAASADGGATFNAPVIVSDDRWQIAACPVSGAALAIGAADKLKIAWFTSGAGGEPGIYESESADGGNTFAPRRLINAQISTNAPVFVSSGDAANFLPLFSADDKIYLLDQPSGAARQIGDGELPAAVSVGKRLFVAAVKNEDKRRVVYLSVVGE